jgi:putative ABC transport system substrate-binding protein
MQRNLARIINLIVVALLYIAPLNVQAQHSERKIHVGVLWHAANEEAEAPFLNALRQGFSDLGYVEGRTLIIENRYAAEQYERFNVNAAELVALKVDILLP